MIRLYHSAMTRSVRVRWILEELGVKYELVTLDFLGGDLKKPEYKKKNPLGAVPTIEDGDVCIFESGAIVEYLTEKYGGGRLAPAPGQPGRAEYLQWLHWSEATATGPIGAMFQNTMIKPPEKRIPAVVDESREKIESWLGALDAALAGKDYLLGKEFSAADVMMGYTVNGAQFLGILDGRFPNVQAYLARLVARPAFQAAQAG